MVDPITLGTSLGLVDTPLLDVPDEVLRPDQASLDALNAEFLA